MDERKQPKNLDAEESVLGAMILSPDALDVAAGILTAGDFYKEQNRLVFNALLALRSQDKDPDYMLLAEELDRRGQLDAAGDKAYLLTLQDTCPNPGAAGHYARPVKETANRRRVIAQAQHIENAAHKDQGPEELLAEIQRLAFDLDAERHIGGALEAEADALPAFMAELEERQDTRNITGLYTGFKHFDNVANGLIPGLFVIAGPPGSGKTTLVKQIADQVAALNDGVPVLFFSYEQSASELRIKSLSRLSLVENRDIMRGRLDDDSGGWSRVKKAAESMGEYAERVYLVEADRSRTVDAIRLAAGRAMRKANAPTCFVCIDYLQIMPTGERFDGAKEKVDLLTSELRRLSRDLDSPVMVVSSINRWSYKKPGIASFKESGSIEFTADIAGILVETDRQEDTREVELRIAKNRNGERATLRFDFDPRISTFREVDKIAYLDEEE